MSDWATRLGDERRAAGAPPITAVVHTLDEEEAIAETLRALLWCDEILVVDMHSTDRTVEIAESLGARVVQHPRMGYVEPARNFAIGEARHDWLLLCDADEHIPEQLARDLATVAGQDAADVVSIPKVSRLCGQWMKATGWGDERHYRFFKRGHVLWSNEIHSVPTVSGRILHLPRHDGNEVLHETARDLEHFFSKLLHYSGHEPDSFAAREVPMSWTLAVEEARQELRNRWSVKEDGTLSAVLSVGLYFYRLLAHARYWERNGFPDVGAPADAEGALQDLGGPDATHPLVKALAQSRRSEVAARQLAAESYARFHEMAELVGTLQSELHRVTGDYQRTISSRSWRALETLRRSRRRVTHPLRRTLQRATPQPPATAVRRYEPPVPTVAEAIGRLSHIDFAEVEDPVASILIPVYNQVGFTARCLASIHRAKISVAYEVIVVDDRSSDETPELLATVPGLRMLRNQENLGFCGAVNAGAALARGEFLVLLNNDTEVEPDWLDTLVDAARSAPDVGAVGSKLLYGDGVLQEAGGIIWNDGVGWNFGRYDDPAKPVYNFRREVEYCSAASLLVRRDLFEELGRFDMRFAPGYYEDTDLCFALRQKGYRVLYEPHSEVVHHEGRTYGTDEDAGAAAVGQHTKLSQEVNRAKFVEKWGQVLAQQHLPNGTARGLLGGRRDRRHRVLVLDTWVPAHDQDSGSLRMAWILRLLAEMGCRVTLYPNDGNARQPYAAEFERGGIEVWRHPWSFAELAEPRPDFYDTILLSRAAVADDLLDPLRRAFPSALIVFDTVDLHFVRESRRMETAGVFDEARIERTRNSELRAIRGSDITAAVTEAEAKIIRDLEPRASVIVLPNVHELPEGDIPPFGARADLLFIGGYLHDPNVDAVHRLVREILPRVRESVPDARLWLVGSHPPPEIVEYHSDDVIVTGFLEDVTEYFRSARVFVAPLRYGAGMKGKIGHALSMGLPIVTTGIGAEGMGLVHGRHAMICDDSDDFADAVVRLYQDEPTWTAMSREGIELVRREWTPEVMRQRLRAVLERSAGRLS